MARVILRTRYAKHNYVHIHLAHVKYKFVEATCLTIGFADTNLFKEVFMLKVSVCVVTPMDVTDARLQIK